MREEGNEKQNESEPLPRGLISLPAHFFRVLSNSCSADVLSSSYHGAEKEKFPNGRIYGRERYPNQSQPWRDGLSIRSRGAFAPNE